MATAKELAAALIPFRDAFYKARRIIRNPDKIDGVAHVVRTTSYYLSYNDFKNAVDMLQSFNNNPETPAANEALRAISFSLTIDDKFEAAAFLQAWTYGDTEEWPEFETFQPDIETP